MRALELKIPPPVVALAVGTGMWGLSLVGLTLPFAAWIRSLAIFGLSFVGVGLAVVGILNFRQANTTINPLQPETASTLVTSGIFAITRNPMYLGLTCFLIAWGIYLSALLPFLGPIAFVLYITKYQIIPEERALSLRFGEAYSLYKNQVRRWI